MEAAGIEPAKCSRRSGDSPKLGMAERHGGAISRPAWYLMRARWLVARGQVACDVCWFVDLAEDGLVQAEALLTDVHGEDGSALR